MSIEWSEALSVHVREIDEQHKKFVGIINEIYDAIYTSKGHDVVGHILDELANYGAYHFATEEKYFDLFKYEEADAHKAEHRKLTADIAGFIERHKAGDDSVPGELIDFVEDWMVHHLENSDKKYTKCFNDHGLF